MTNDARGTGGWFKREKQHLVEWAKAVDSFAASVRTFRKLVELGTTADTEVRSALLNAGVVRYARPFSANRSSTGSSRFPTNVNKRDPSFDKDIHSHLLTLRDKLIAHSDADYADGRLFAKCLTAAPQNFRLLVGASIATMTVHMLEDMEFAARCLTHVEAVEKASYAQLTERFQQFVLAAYEFPQALEESASEQRAPILAGSFQLTPENPSSKRPVRAALRR